MRALLNWTIDSPAGVVEWDERLAARRALELRVARGVLPDDLDASADAYGWPAGSEQPEPERADWHVRERERIRGRAERTVQIEHVGSTSVPGLPAKPVVDIVLVVADSADEAAYVPDLEAAGYRLRHRVPFWYEHQFLVEEPAVQIYVFSVGCVEVERMLLFRDRLRNHPEDR